MLAVCLGEKNTIVHKQVQLLLVARSIACNCCYCTVEFQRKLKGTARNSSGYCVVYIPHTHSYYIFSKGVDFQRFKGVSCHFYKFFKKRLGKYIFWCIFSRLYTVGYRVYTLITIKRQRKPCYVHLYMAIL